MLEPLSTKSTPGASVDSVPYESASAPPNRFSTNHEPTKKTIERFNSSHAVGFDRPASAGSFFFTLGLTLLCPCIPAAQIASSVGKPFVTYLAIFAGIYTAGIVSYGTAAGLQNTFVPGASVLGAYFVQVITFMCSPIALSLIVFYKITDTRWSPDAGTTAVESSGAGNEKQVNPAAVVLVAMNILLDVLFALVLLRLRELLDRRIKLHGDERGVGCREATAVVCCTSCSLLEMTWAVKNVSKTSTFHLAAVDELPPYDGDSDVAKHKKNQVAVVSIPPV